MSSVARAFRRALAASAAAIQSQNETLTGADFRKVDNDSEGEPMATKSSHSLRTCFLQLKNQPHILELPL